MKERITDLGLNLNYLRCETCGVPMHVDGHEKCAECGCGPAVFVEVPEEENGNE